MPKVCCYMSGGAQICVTVFQGEGRSKEDWCDRYNRLVALEKQSHPPDEP